MITQCDEIDGVKDGLIENPLICDFDITTLACSTGSNLSMCLSDLQIEAAQQIYAGPHDVRTNASLYPGMGVTSEVEWLAQLGSLAEAFSIPILQNLVFSNLNYDASTFNWGSDVDLVDQRAGALIDEISPDLSAFQARGGKLIVTQGWSDAYNAATWPIDHLHQVEDKFGGDVSEWFELFMVPGTVSTKVASRCEHHEYTKVFFQVADTVASVLTLKPQQTGIPWRSWYNGLRRERFHKRC